jgi:hypothetical protein
MYMQGRDQPFKFFVERICFSAKPKICIFFLQILSKFYVENSKVRLYFFFVYLLAKFQIKFGRLMVFNATFNNTSAISWRSVLMVEENGVPGENH